MMYNSLQECNTVQLSLTKEKKEKCFFFSFKKKQKQQKTALYNTLQRDNISL